LIFKNPRTFGEPGRWTVYQSYFGGRIAAVVNFPGPNKEEWNTLDIVAPIGSRDWRTIEYSLFLPLDVTIDVDSTKIMPSLDWSKIEHKMTLVPSQPKKKKWIDLPRRT
jgi:hypothetical protein